MKACLRPFNRRHEQLMQRARVAPKGLREARRHDLVMFVAECLAAAPRRSRRHRGRRRS